MAIIAKKGNQSFDLPPAGTFQAVVFAVYDGGYQKDNFQGDEKELRKIRIGLELDEVYQSGQYAGERITRYPEYTLSLGDKSKLLPVVESIMGRPLTAAEKEGFDLVKMIGKNCQVTIMHKVSQKGREYADTQIGAILKNIPPLSPKASPNYMPEFISKWISVGRPAQNEDLEENIDEKENVAMDEMILESYVKDGLLTYPEIKSTIRKQAGETKLMRELPIEKRKKILQICEGLALQRKIYRDSNIDDSFNDEPVTPPIGNF